MEERERAQIGVDYPRCSRKEEHIIPFSQGLVPTPPQRNYTGTYVQKLFEISFANMGSEPAFGDIEVSTSKSHKLALYNLKSALPSRPPLSQDLFATPVIGKDGECPRKFHWHPQSSPRDSLLTSNVNKSQRKYPGSPKASSCPGLLLMIVS